jgi:hypothetical protein
MKTITFSTLFIKGRYVPLMDAAVDQYADEHLRLWSFNCLPWDLGREVSAGAMITAFLASNAPGQGPDTIEASIYSAVQAQATLRTVLIAPGTSWTRPDSEAEVPINEGNIASIDPDVARYAAGLIRGSRGDMIISQADIDLAKKPAPNPGKPTAKASA